MPTSDPTIRDHKAWLGYVQQEGLVVSPAALVDAQLVLDRNTLPMQERFLPFVKEVAPDGEDPVPAITDFPAFARGFLQWPEELSPDPECLMAPNALAGLGGDDDVAGLVGGAIAAGKRGQCEPAIAPGPACGFAGKPANGTQAVECGVKNCCLSPNGFCDPEWPRREAVSGCVEQDHQAGGAGGRGGRSRGRGRRADHSGLWGERLKAER